MQFTLKFERNEIAKHALCYKVNSRLPAREHHLQYIRRKQ